MIGKIKLQILSDKIQEKILYESIYSGLWVNGEHDSHPTSISGFTRDLKGNILDYSNSPDYIKIDINIDFEVITFYTHKNIKRGYLHHFYYNSDNRFDSGEKFKYQLYLVTDDVLDGRSFFTISPTERRRLKIKRLKQKILY